MVYMKILLRESQLLTFVKERYISGAERAFLCRMLKHLKKRLS